MEVSQVVALRGPGWPGSLTACRPRGLASERRAGLPGPRRGVAQKRRERHGGLGNQACSPRSLPASMERGIPVAAVMIGVDPHKASHTAVAISAAEEPLGGLRVRACAAQAERLLGWA